MYIRERYGLNVWYDQWEIRVGDSLISKIDDGIKSQDYLVVVLSKASVSSEWVRRELNAGLMKELSQMRVVVLPLLIEECEVPTLIYDKVYADFRKDYHSGLNKLLKVFPGYLFPSGIDITDRNQLSNNIYLENVIVNNINDQIVK